MGTRTEKENRDEHENRVLVFMPTGRDAALVCATLEKAGVAAEACGDAETLDREIAAGAGAVLLAEEGLQNGALERLVEIFNRQPVWSDLPVVLFAGSPHNSEKLLTTIGTRLNATIVERPIRVAMLVSAVRGALRARQKQYQTRDLLNQLEESDRQKDLFLATLSHELRTPLNSILGWVQLLRDAKPGTVDAERGLEVIERNARAQSEIVSDILFVSRIITGKLRLNLQPVDLIPVIKEAVEVVQPSVEAKNIKLSVRFDEKIQQIKGDRDRLKQVFWNLLSNAVKFTPPGGSIDVKGSVKGSSVEIEIRDSGVGIEPEFLPHIFERFSQADSSYTRKVGGLGLGLAIVRHLVELHGGSVGVRSEGANSGASFTVKLPVLTAGETNIAADENTSKNGFGENDDHSPAPGIRALLVEDNEDSREMLVVLFGNAGLQTTAVASASEAIAALENKSFDILISDIGMPDEDGYYLIRRIRSLPPEKGGRIPAIALTGYASLQDRDRALQSGYQEHLAKPVNVNGLLEMVKTILEREENSKNTIPMP